VSPLSEKVVSGAETDHIQLVGITAGLRTRVKAMLRELIGEQEIAIDYGFLNSADFA
jgi:hypothetical protein